MRRVSVVGPSGSGTSTLARRLARLVDVPFTELDAVFHRPGWQLLDPDEFRATVEGVAAAEAWAIDGNSGALPGA